MIAFCSTLLSISLWSFASAETIVVKSGDTPAGLSQKYCGDSSKWKLLWSGDPKKLPQGHIITLPEQCGKTAGQEEKKGPEKVVDKVGEELSPTEPAGSGKARAFRRPGAKPLCKSFTQDPKGCIAIFLKALTQKGWSEEEQKKFADDLVSGNTTQATRKNGDTWNDGFISGKNRNGRYDEWGQTVVDVPGGSVAVTVCPLVGNKRVDIVNACGNLGISTVIVETPKPQPEAPFVPETPRSGCALDWFFMGQYARSRSMRNVSGKGQASCQFQIDEHLSDGPLLTVAGSQYHGYRPQWDEYAMGIGLGNRLRGKEVYGFHQIELDTSLAYASTRGGHGDVRKPPINGLDFLFNLSLKQYYSLSDSDDEGEYGDDDTPVSAEGISFSLTSGNIEESKRRVLGEYSLYATIPLTNKSGPVYWRNQVVDHDSRHSVFGFSVLFGLEDPDMSFIPEAGAGFWHTSGVKHPFGFDVRVGGSTKDRFIRLYVGAGYSGETFGFIEGQLNGGGKWLFDSYEKSVEAVTVDSKSSCPGLGLDEKDCPQPKLKLGLGVKAEDSKDRPEALKKPTRHWQNDGFFNDRTYMAASHGPTPVVSGQVMVKADQRVAKAAPHPVNVWGDHWGNK